MTTLLALLLSSPALAFESVPQEFVFELQSRDRDVFDAIEREYSVGADEVGLRFRIKSLGGADIGINAESQITWPDVLTHDLHGYPDGGWFELIANIDVILDIYVDFDLYTGGWVLWSDGLDMRDEVEFDGLLLPGGVPESVTVDAAGTGIDQLVIPVDIVWGLSIELKMDIFPLATSTLTGIQVLNVTGDDVDGSIKSTEDELTQIDVPTDDPGLVEFESTWRGTLDAALAVVFQPSVDACVEFIGCYEVFSTDLPVDLVSFGEIVDFKPVDYEHPLPAINVGIANHDFGEVELGGNNNLPVPIENIGQLPLEGTATIEGSEHITVFPDYFFANAGQTDGVMITFTPEAASDESAILVLESNDPQRPRIEIPLLGNGFEDIVLDTGPLGEGRTESIKSCGCSSSTGASGVWVFGLVGLLGLRRRKSQD